MPKLTIAASNKNRLKLDCNISQHFLKSIQWQEYTDFELLIADGGSENYEEIKEYFEKHDGPIPMRIVQHKIGNVFERALLNNVGVRNGNGEYVMTTDVDMLLGPQFVATLMENVGEHVLVESRTMYLKSAVTKKIYSGEYDPYNDLKSIKRGRIKKRTTAGGCQCMSKVGWDIVRGFDERYYGWGSEDYDLLTRAKKAGLKVRWMGESEESIMLFHQSHPKKNVKRDLEHQEENKKLLRRIATYRVNPEGWGGIKDED